MAVAPRAPRFDPDHAVAGVANGQHVSFIERRPETRPAGAALEFGLGLEQRQSAQTAAVDAVFLVAQQSTAERRLGSVVEQDVALLLIEVSLQSFAFRLGRGVQIEPRGGGMDADLGVGHGAAFLRLTRRHGCHSAPTRLTRPR